MREEKREDVLKSVRCIGEHWCKSSKLSKRVWDRVRRQHQTKHLPSFFSPFILGPLAFLASFSELARSLARANRPLLGWLVTLVLSLNSSRLPFSLTFSPPSLSLYLSFPLCSDLCNALYDDSYVLTLLSKDSI